MKKDFSVLGRERFLFSTFFDRSQQREAWLPEFARRTLIERVVWSFMPDGVYSHFDGFSSDQFHRFRNGFTIVGRVWLLSEPGTPGNIATILALEFDRDKQCVGRARFWIGPVREQRQKAPFVQGVSSFERTFSGALLGAEWNLTLEKSDGEWRMTPGADLSILTMPTRD